MSQFKEMKFNIGKDKELSKKVQDILFGLGYSWWKNGSTRSHLGKEYLYTETNGSLSYGDSKEFFDKDQAEEINIDWFRSTGKETIELGGKKYYKEELEEALKHINPVN